MKNYSTKISKLMICVLMVMALMGTSKVQAMTPQEYVDLNYGLFIHYGINTYTGTHGWVDIHKDHPSELVNPTDFDANQWAEAAVSAGMKYLIYTAKHHYGWCGWDSAYTDYDVATSSVPDLDTVEEVRQACEDNGLEFCLYYSLPDWHHYYINGNNKNDQYTQFAKNQITELLTNYGEVTLLWFDIAKFMTNEQLVEIYNHVKSLQPDCIVLFNWRNEFADIDVYEAPYELIPDGNTDPAEVDFNLYDYDFGNGWWNFTNTLGPNWTVEKAKEKILENNAKNGVVGLNIPPGPNGKLTDAAVTWLQNLGTIMNDTSTVVDGSDSQIQYQGNWSHVSRVESYGNTISYSNEANASLEYTFSGNSVKFYTQMGPGAGIFDLYIDDVKVTTFDSYNPVHKHQVLAYENQALTDGEHTIKLVNTGENNPSSSNYYCHLDYLTFE